MCGIGYIYECMHLYLDRRKVSERTEKSTQGTKGHRGRDSLCNNVRSENSNQN